MKDSIVDRILKLNKEFYQRNARSFSETRGFYWHGWFKLLEIIKTIHSNSMSVIDLGCGNCRFYDFLRNIGRDFTYLGIDSNKGLLEIAVEKFGRENNFSVKEKDLILNLDSISGSFDMAVVFGVMHHLPSENIRNNFIKHAGGLVKKSGVLVLSFWEIENCKEVEIPGLSKSDLDSGDFFLAWKGDKDSVRYVHKYSLNEIENICKLLAQEGFKLESRFIDDFNSKSDNLYLVFRRT